tara:strand:- start:19 stop:492 length:474 start_codon:yes stop_codon:yes gene_type:complete
MKSYNDPGLNCQFYPSCSNFCAISIYKEGSIIGISKGLDRFIRCNNSAQKKYKVYEYGTFNYGGNRLIDEYIEGSIKSNKSFYIGLGLTVVPGLGRAYYGQIEDAKNSFLYTVGFGLLSLIMKENSKDTISMGFAITSLFFWSTDFLALYKMDSIEK